MQIGQTVFFKHKYLTQPSVTESDALLRASDELCAALRDTVAPVKGDTRRAVDMLMDIFKNVAKKTKTPEDSRRSVHNHAAITRSKSGKSEASIDWILADKSKIGEADIGDDNIRSSESIAITHG